VSAGTPSSQVLSRCIAPVSRTTTHVGPNGLVPATHNCGVPDTYRTFAWRPSTSTSRSCFSICAKARSRRPVRNARSSARTSVPISVFSVWGIGVVGQPDMPVLGDDDDLFTAVTAGAFLPHHRLEDHHHARLEDEVLVELVAEIGSDHGCFGRVHTDAVPEVEVRQPWPGAAVGFRRRPAQVRYRGTGPHHAEHSVHDLLPFVVLRVLPRRRLVAHHPGPAE